ncbi:MAG: 1-aminocyclopropane-1-carboxylate deaminase [Flavobacteriia bacterium]|nr:MAG: 1-aminocyclopropane-1-carboxylate deaminase [Flavobacteriia bacterium]
MLLPLKPVINQSITYQTPDKQIIELTIKREDLLHQHISGNKYRKLRYNLQEAKEQKHTKIITFGGAFSNHIAATAAAAHEFGFESTGVIRGQELAGQPEVVLQNPTLRFAIAHGMRLKFVSRESYRQKHTEAFINDLLKDNGPAYIVPEGGTNTLAVKGCEEILTDKDKEFDTICCAVGTGGTISGIINATSDHQKVMGFQALKGGFLKDVINSYTIKHKHWSLNDQYTFGGFAKVSPELIRFINDFKQQTGVALDPIYTGKMMFGIVDLYKKGVFNTENRILAIHTGGLQGIEGMNQRLKSKNKTLII